VHTTHNPKSPLDFFQQMLDAFTHPGKEEGNGAARRVVMSFHDWDKQGDAFRYAVRRGGGPLTLREQQIDLVRLSDVMEGFANLLGGVDGGFDAVEAERSWCGRWSSATATASRATAFTRTYLRFANSVRFSGKCDSNQAAPPPRRSPWNDRNFDQRTKSAKSTGPERMGCRRAKFGGRSVPAGQQVRRQTLAKPGVFMPAS
jgi:hypothetical protein